MCVKSKAEKEALQNVLDDFFILTDDGYYSEYCQSILNDTTDRAEASRENGKKGGRPPKQSQSETKANAKQDESQDKASQNLEKTQDKPSQNLDENYPNTHNPLPNNPNTQIPPNPQSGVCVGDSDEVLAKAEQVKQANAEDIQNWVAPPLDEMRSILFHAGYSGTLTEQQYGQLVADFKTYFAEQAIIGRPIVTDGLRKQKLREWIQRNNSNSRTRNSSNSPDPLAVNAKFRPSDTGMIASNTVFEADADGNFIARPIQSDNQSAWHEVW